MADYTHFDAGTFAKWLFTKIKGLLSGYVKTSDSRLSDARKASDVSAWAKASSKPSYSWGEITGKPSTFPPSTHTHTKSQITDLGVFGGASATAAGLVPQPAAGDQDKYLSAKGTWESITGKISGTKVTSANSADKLTTSRTLTIGNTGKSFDGSANISWSLSEIGAIGTFNRSDVGNAPNFDDPGVNGLFEIRSSIETPNETGVKPFNAYGACLSIKTRDNIAMMQIAGCHGSRDSYFIRATQSANVTMKNVPWKRIALFSDIPTSLPASDVYSWAKASSKPSYSWSEITGKPSTFPPSTHTHTKSQITDFPSSIKNPNALSITANGKTVTYDGSSAQSISISSGGSKSVVSTLLASGWQGSAAPYTYDLGSTYSNKSVMIGYDGTKYSEDSMAAASDADIVGGEGTVIYAYGEKPTVDIPIIIQYS